MKNGFENFSIHEFLQILLVLLLLLPFALFSIYRFMYLPSPYYQAKNFQELSKVCSSYTMVLPEEHTIPFENNEYMIYLESQRRNSRPIGYHISSANQVPTSYIYWSVDCSPSNEPTSSLSNVTEYQGIPIQWVFEPVHTVNDTLIQGYYASFILDSYQYHVSVTLSNTESECYEELVCLFQAAIYSIIEQGYEEGVLP